LKMDTKSEVGLLSDVHIGLLTPKQCTFSNLVKGSYMYFHYNCDGTDDRGWGCGYRTAQTLCSWVYNQELQQGRNPSPVPSIRDIQETLVAMGDKPPHFVDTKYWIGSYEAFLTLDQLYQVACKIIHVQSGKNIVEQVDPLSRHFESIGSPLMMGGDTDASSKGILGICGNDSNTYLLVLDPHLSKPPCDAASVQMQGFCRWVSVNDFMDSSFYNFCLPLYGQSAQIKD